MAKTKATALAEELGTDYLTVSTLIEEHVSEDQVTGKGKNTWLTDDAVNIIKDKMEVPELIPDYYMGHVSHEGRNRNYVYAHIKDLDKRVPVVVARRFRGKLLGKTIKIEQITDATGSSFRYVPTRFTP
jgi:hypothetical protein